MRKRKRILTNGEVVKRFRKAAGYTYAKDIYPAMKDLGISSTTYRVMEQGKLATHENIEIVASFFGCRPEELMDDRPNTSVQKSPESSLYGVFAANLAAYMEYRDISANSIAHRAGMNSRTVWSIQNAETNASLDSLKTICDVLGIDLLLMLIPSVSLDALDNSRRHRRSLESLVNLDEEDAAVVQGLLAWFGHGRRDDQMMIETLSAHAGKTKVTTKHRQQPRSIEFKNAVTEEADNLFAEATDELRIVEAELRTSMNALEGAIKGGQADKIEAAKLSIAAQSERVHATRKRVNTAKKNRKALYNAQRRRLRSGDST